MEYDKIVMQFTSIGRLGPNENDWFKEKLLSALENSKKSKPICVSLKNWFAFIEFNIFYLHICIIINKFFRYFHQLKTLN